MSVSLTFLIGVRLSDEGRRRWKREEFLGAFAAAAAAAKSLQSCPTLWDPIDGSPPGSPVPGILQARTLEWFAISFSNAWKWKVKVKSLSRVQLLSDPMDCSLPGSSVHGICQARALEWVAIAFSSVASNRLKASFIHSSLNDSISLDAKSVFLNEAYIPRWSNLGLCI